MNEPQEQANDQNPNGMDFGIQRIYVKDISYESPSSPHIFREQWEPKVEIDLQSKWVLLEEGIYEVILSVTSTVKIKDKVAFIAEVHHAGIFTIRNFPEDQLQHLLGSFCPSIIFPYAREAITDVVTRGGFPQLYLAPINFDAIYQQKLAKQQQDAEPEKVN